MALPTLDQPKDAMNTNTMGSAWAPSYSGNAMGPMYQDGPAGLTADIIGAPAGHGYSGLRWDEALAGRGLFTIATPDLPTEAATPDNQTNRALFVLGSKSDGNVSLRFQVSRDKSGTFLQIRSDAVGVLHNCTGNNAATATMWRMGRNIADGTVHFQASSDNGQTWQGNDSALACPPALAAALDNEAGVDLFIEQNIGVPQTNGPQYHFRNLNGTTGTGDRVGAVVPAVVTGVVVSTVGGASLSGLIGTTLQLAAVVNGTGVGGTGAPPQGVSWISQDEDIATISETGLVTRLTAGSVTIAAISTFDGDFLGTINVVVTAPPPDPEPEPDLPKSDDVLVTVRDSVTKAALPNRSVVVAVINKAIAKVVKTTYVTNAQGQFVMTIASGAVGMTKTRISVSGVTKDVDVIVQPKES